MRKLTIKRAKRFVACLGKIRIYIEDPTSDEIVINGVACRKLGDLKNGEEQSFEIGEQSARIFAIADKLSKDYCNEVYALDEGTEDVYLTGKNEFNPASGNAFRFDNNNTPEAIENRKKSKKKGIIVLCIALAVGILLGFFISYLGLSGKKSAKDFSAEEMTITLTNEFKESKEEKFDAAFLSKYVAVLVIREDFSDFPGAESLPLTNYGNLVISVNNTSSQLESKGDLKYFKYDSKNTETGENFTFTSFVYKSDEAFWIVQFAVAESKYSDYSDSIFKWADSVKFSK